MSSVFQSEDECDWWINNHIQLPECGKYVDAGCAHPVRLSQTHWLRMLGWSGLAIDGSSAYAEEWRNVPNAKFIQAVLSDEPKVRFLHEPTNTLVSRVHPEGQEVQGRRLSAILRENHIETVNFLSVDVENSECDVMSDLFREGIFPEIIVAEYHSEHAGRNPRLIEMIIQSGYNFVHMTNSNGVFVLRK